MLKRLFLAILLFAAAGRAAAVDYTDIWYLAAEAGWGVNVVQSDNFLFITFFIYGADGKPTWYTGQVTLDASGNYNGTLYAATGTYYISPWAPGSLTNTAVGTVSFQPTGPTTAKLAYVVNNTGTVTKLIQRQTLTVITLGGVYSGAEIGTYSGCANNISYNNFFDMQITQLANGNVTFTVNYPDVSSFSCTFSGTLVQQGQLYSVPGATYQCTDGTNTTATMTEIKATAQGVEGKFSATFSGACKVSAVFSGALN
jgi:hypothetical protein